MFQVIGQELETVGNLLHVSGRKGVSKIILSFGFGASENLGDNSVVMSKSTIHVIAVVSLELFLNDMLSLPRMIFHVDFETRQTLFPPVFCLFCFVVILSLFLLLLFASLFSVNISLLL